MVSQLGFNVHRGVSQSCPISPFVFITAMKFLSIAIKRIEAIRERKITLTTDKFLCGLFTLILKNDNDARGFKYFEISSRCRGFENKQRQNAIAQ